MTGTLGDMRAVGLAGGYNDESLESWSPEYSSHLVALVAVRHGGRRVVNAYLQSGHLLGVG